MPQKHVVLSQKILEVFTALKYSPKSKDLIHNGRAAPSGTAFWALVKKELGEDFTFKLRVENEALYAAAERDPIFITQVREDIKASLLKAINEESKKAAEVIQTVTFNDSISCPLEDLLIIENVREDKAWMLYDPIKDEAHNYAYTVIQNTINRKVAKEVREHWYSTNTRQCIFQYCPHKDRLFKEKGHWIFNTWNKPEWMIGWVPDANVTSLPIETEEFLDHLSPLHKSQMLSWLKDAVFKRADPVLILRGASGCGKNMFIEHLGASLVGASGISNNYAKATRRFVQSSFHAYLGRATIVLWDEATLGDEMKQTMKDYHNTVATLEEKNQRVSSPTTLSCSMVLITNYKKKVQLEYNDRKFWVPTLSDVDLLDVKDKGWVDHLTKVLWKDKEYLRRIASYLHYHVKSVKHFPVKTPQFLELAWFHLPAFFKKFIRMAVTKKVFTSKDYFQGWQGNRTLRPHQETLREHLDSYEVGQKLRNRAGEFEELSDGVWEFKSNIFGKTELLQFDEVYKGQAKSGGKMPGSTVGIDIGVGRGEK